VEGGLQRIMERISKEEWKWRKKNWRKGLGALTITLYNDTDSFSDDQIWKGIRFILKNLKGMHYMKMSITLQGGYTGYSMGPRFIAIVVRECFCYNGSLFRGRYITSPRDTYYFDYDDMPYNGVIVLNVMGYPDVVYFPKFREGFKVVKRGFEREYLGKLLLNPFEDLISILAHELRHVWQDDSIWQCDKVIEIDEKTEMIKPRCGSIWGTKHLTDERDANAFAIKIVRMWRRLEEQKQEQECQVQYVMESL
jgi:hypothetical protein